MDSPARSHTISTERQVAQLRNLLAERFTQAAPVARQQIRTGVPSLDEATGGGLAGSALTELVTPGRSAGSASLLHELLQLAQGESFFVALVDGRDSFDPQSAGANLLPHLFWVRCDNAWEAVKATDLLLRDGNFPLIILDLVLNSPAELRRIPASTWYRFQRLIEPVPSALLVMSRHHLVPSARRKLVLANHWKLRDLQQEPKFERLRFEVHRAHRQVST